MCSQKNRAEGRDFSIYPLPSHKARPPPPLWTRVLYLLRLMTLHQHVIVCKGLYLTLGFTLAVVFSVGLDKYIMTCITIIITNIVSVFILCPFRILWSWNHSFLGWFLSLTNVHLSLLHVFSWLIAHLFLLLQNSALSRSTTVDTFTYWRKYCLLSHFGNHE